MGRQNTIQSNCFLGVVKTPIKVTIKLVMAAVLLFASPLYASSIENIAIPESPSGQLKISYPLDETLFPPEIVAPTFLWSDQTEGVAQWRVLLKFVDGHKTLIYPSKETNWRPSVEAWELIKQQSTKHDAQVAIIGLDAQGEKIAASEIITIRTSTDPVGDSIFYREVPLPFIEAVQDPSRIRWRMGSVDTETAPTIVLENLPVCGNCHSFSGDGKVLGMDVDYGNDKGGYAILPVSDDMVLNDEKIITWSDFKREDGEATFGLLSQVSPDGRYVISTVKDRAVFVATPGIAFSQLFFPIKGILVVYDTVEETFTALPGADDPDYVQSNPTWSPDGKWIVYARSKAYMKDSIANINSVLLSDKDVPEFTEDNEPYKYDLYRVPFNGGAGGIAEPLKGASNNNMSNFFAKYSPDGKWIVFTMAENYMLLMPDSELYIIPAEGGEARRLRANTPLMNSWHSFSSNSRWLVFSSKANTPYTQLFLTHIDEQGESTPPIVLDRFTSSDRAANIPEFVPLPANSITKIKEQFLDAYSFLRAGMANERTGDYPAAVKSYYKGLEAEPENVELLNSLGFALFQQGKSDEAVVSLEKALKIDPKHWKAHNNMALASIDIGELELAEAHYRESLAIEPQPAIYNDLGFVLERQGMPSEAIEMYRKSIEMDPESTRVQYNLAATLARIGEFTEAETHFQEILKKAPNSQAYSGLGFVFRQQGKLDLAVENFKGAIKADPKNAIAYGQLGAIQVEQKKLEEAVSTYQLLVSNQPSAAAHEELAKVLKLLGRTKQANEQLKQAKAMKSAE